MGDGYIHTPMRYRTATKIALLGGKDCGKNELSLSIDLSHNDSHDSQLESCRLTEEAASAVIWFKTSMGLRLLLTSDLNLATLEPS